jgi:hypothetical protein
MDGKDILQTLKGIHSFLPKRDLCNHISLKAEIIIWLEMTVEDPSVTDEEGHWWLCDQNENIGLYAHDDYVRKISFHGFRIEALEKRHLGEEIFRSLGLKRTSTLYEVTK